MQLWLHENSFWMLRRWYQILWNLWEFPSRVYREEWQHMYHIVHFLFHHSVPPIQINVKNLPRKIRNFYCWNLQLWCSQALIASLNEWWCLVEKWFLLVRGRFSCLMMIFLRLGTISSFCLINQVWFEDCLPLSMCLLCYEDPSFLKIAL